MQCAIPGQETHPPDAIRPVSRLDGAPDAGTFIACSPESTLDSLFAASAPLPFHRLTILFVNLPGPARELCCCDAGQQVVLYYLSVLIPSSLSLSLSPEIPLRGWSSRKHPASIVRADSFPQSLRGRGPVFHHERGQEPASHVREQRGREPSGRR